MSVPNQAQRSAFIGFDRLFEDLNSFSLQQSAYPPHNIKSYSEDWYVVELAVAGFLQHEIQISVHDSVITVTGEQEGEELESIKYIHKGIANRKFTKLFRIGEHTKVTQANLNDGILSIHLERDIPEDQKPQIIKINEDHI